MTRKIDVAWLLDRNLGSFSPAVLVCSVAIVLLLMPLIVLASVIALLTTTALAVGSRRREHVPEERFGVLAPVVVLGQTPELERSLTASWETVRDQAA